MDKEKFKDSINLGKEMIKKIDTLVGLYMGMEDERQGITRNQEGYVMQRIDRASGYVNSRARGITATEERLYRMAKESLDQALRQTNAFFSKDWAAYRGLIEKMDLSPFKETKVLTLEE